MNNTILNGLQDIVGKEWIITNREQMIDYMTDAIYDAVVPEPAEDIVLVKPADAKEISEILKLANKENFPVIVRGGGTGLAGGAIPNIDCVLLSLERLDKIEEVDKSNLMITAQAGVSYAEFTEAAEKAGMFFPPKPGDVGADVGGVVACNAAGARASRYGVTRNFVKGIEVVLPTGEIVKLGGKLLKNAMGLDLLHLMIGSEGALGIITKATLRLVKKPTYSATVLASFNSRMEAIKAAPYLTEKMIIPLAGEYLDHDLCELTANYLGVNWPAQKGEAHLFFISIGENEDDVFAEAEVIANICEEQGAIDILLADRKEDQDNILKIRGEIATAQRSAGTVGDFLDICVPPLQVVDLLARIIEIEKKYDTHIPVTGHAIDGNLHPTPERELVDRDLLEKVKEEIYQATIDLGGTISGEHGLGITRLHNCPLWPDENVWKLMTNIKKSLDPNGILNPKRVFLEVTS
jgi:glycolate oxidase